MQRIVCNCCNDCGCLAVAGQLELSAMLGAHPWWAFMVGYIGVIIALPFMLVVHLIGKRRQPAIPVTY